MFHHHDQYAVLSPFYTIRVAFTKGPQPLVGCYSIFKHHSAKSQPPHRPALHTCNKLSSSETTKNELDQSWTGPLYWIIPHKHFHFCMTWPPKLLRSQCMCLGLSVHPLNLANSRGLLLFSALICLLMTDVMQSHFATAVDKICRRLDASHAEPPPYPTAWSANICVWNGGEKSPDLLIN